MRLISAGSLVRAQSGPVFARVAIRKRRLSRRSPAATGRRRTYHSLADWNAASFRRRFHLWRDKTTRQATISIFQFWILDCRLLISRNAFPVRQSGGLVPWQAFL